MKKTVLVIENDLTLKGADYVNAFIRYYDGDVIEMTNFSHRDQREIFEAVSKCTDIAVQTCFVNGSDNQLYGMVKLLSKIKPPINVYIAYLGLRNGNELYEYLVENLKVEDLISIEQHKIYDMSCSRWDSQPREPHILLNFESITSKHKNNLASIEEYKNTACTRPTGRKILVLGCNGFGKAFENLPIGQEVDELECDKLLTKGKPPRGVWIWGNGEPIMLVNDVGFREYKIITKMNSESVLDEVIKVVNLSKDITKKQLTQRGLLQIIEDDDEELSPMDKANLICELLKIEKRGNRQNIYRLLSENLVESK